MPKKKKKKAKVKKKTSKKVKRKARLILNTLWICFPGVLEKIMRK